MDDRDGFAGLIDGVVEVGDGLAVLLSDGFNGVSAPGVRDGGNGANVLASREPRLNREPLCGAAAGWDGAGCAGAAWPRDVEPVRDPPQLRDDVLAALGVLDVWAPDD